MQAVIDNLPTNVKLILCGSYNATMKELLYEDNPFSVVFPWFCTFAILIITRLRNFIQICQLETKSPFIASSAVVRICLKTSMKKRR